MAQRNVIHRALATHLADNFSKASVVVWENTTLDPAGLDVWFEEIFIPNDTRPATVGINGVQEDFGLYQINIRVPIGLGTIQSDNYVDEISQLYKMGTKLEKDGESVYIEGSTAGPGTTEDNWYFVPFTIEWSSYMTIN